MVKHKTSIMVSLFVTVLLSGCATKEPVQTVTEPIRTPPTFDEEQLKEQHLRLRWETPIADKEILDIYMLGNRLYAVTEDQQIYCVKRENGYIDWIYDTPWKLDIPPARAEETLYIIGHDILLALDRFGLEKWRKPLPFSPSAPMVASETTIFVPSLSHPVYGKQRLNAFNVDSKDSGFQMIKWHINVGGNIFSKPVISPPKILFASADGYLHCSDTHLGSDEDEKRGWTFETKGPIIADLALDENTVYVGSTDYILYAIEAQTALLRWKFQTGSQIVLSPWPAGDTVYVASKGNGLFALNKADGSKKWWLETAQRFLMRGERSVYLLDGDNNLLIVHNETGKIQSTIPLKSFDFFIANTDSSIMYLATRDGFLFALEEQL